MCEFQCSTGYNLVGSSSRRCQSNKQWSGTAVQCEGKCTLVVIVSVSVSVSVSGFVFLLFFFSFCLFCFVFLFFFLSLFLLFFFVVVVILLFIRFTGVPIPIVLKYSADNFGTISNAPATIGIAFDFTSVQIFHLL